MGSPRAAAVRPRFFAPQSLDSLTRLDGMGSIQVSDGEEGEGEEQKHPVQLCARGVAYHPPHIVAVVAVAAAIITN